MTDRELLELAAKAAGVQGCFIESFPEDGAPTYSCGIGNAGRIIPLWNPLANDGDALRLANKLRINVYNGDPASTVCGRNGITGFRVDVESNADAATRRAIVLAAAEISKKK